jgi:hypothetical protein
MGIRVNIVAGGAGDLAVEERKTPDVHFRDDVDRVLRWRRAVLMAVRQTVKAHSSVLRDWTHRACGSWNGPF